MIELNIVILTRKIIRLSPLGVGDGPSLTGVGDKSIPLKLCTIEIKFRQDNWIDMNQVHKDLGTTENPARFQTELFRADSLDP